MKLELAKTFEMDLGEARIRLCLKIERHSSEQTLWLMQSKYASSVPMTFITIRCHAVNTPMEHCEIIESKDCRSVVLITNLCTSS